MIDWPLNMPLNYEEKNTQRGTLFYIKLDQFNIIISLTVISDNRELFFFYNAEHNHNTAEKIKFSIKNCFSNCDQIRSFLRIWSHLLKKYLMENFVFCAVLHLQNSRFSKHHQMVRSGY